MGALGKIQVTKRSHHRVDAVEEPRIRDAFGRVARGGRRAEIPGPRDDVALVLHHLDQPAQQQQQTIRRGDPETGWNELFVERELPRPLTPDTRELHADESRGNVAESEANVLTREENRTLIAAGIFIRDG